MAQEHCDLVRQVVHARLEREEVVRRPGLLSTSASKSICTGGRAGQVEGCRCSSGRRGQDFMTMVRSWFLPQ